MGAFEEILSSIKANESDRAENMMPLTEDAQLRNGLLAWQSVTVERNMQDMCPENDERRQWQWLWAQVRFDAKRFALVAGVKEYEANVLLERLKALYLIYPDGTSNSIAKNYLKALVKAKLPKALRQPAKKATDDTESGEQSEESS